jgi:hypothetical protein
VPAYRIYKIDGSGGFLAAEWLEADDDEAALEAARSQPGAFELWHRSRLVGESGPRLSGNSPDDYDSSVSK